MAWPGKQTWESLIYKLSVLASGLVLLFSLWNGYHFLMIILRVILAFCFIYFLGKGLMVLWESLSPPKQKWTEYQSKIDVLLGDLNPGEEIDDSEEKSGEKTTLAELSNEGIPQQINGDLKKRMQDTEQQAEFVKRMGWGE